MHLVEIIEPTIYMDQSIPNVQVWAKNQLQNRLWTLLAIPKSKEPDSSWLNTWVDLKPPSFRNTE